MSYLTFSPVTRRITRLRIFNATLAAIALVTGSAVAQDDLRVYYQSGAPVEQISRDGVTVMVSLVDTGKLNKVKVCVVNDSNNAINIVPDQVRVHQSSPKDEYLEVRSQRDLQRSIDHGLIWKEILIGLAAGLSRNYTTIQTSSVGVVGTPYGSGLVYGSTVTTISSPDWELRAQWFALGDRIAAEGKTAKELIAQQSLKKNTIFPGTQLTGTLWFRRHQALESGTVDVAIGTRHYDFLFPAPGSAKAPMAPGAPVQNSEDTAGIGPGSPKQSPINRNPVAAFGLVVRTLEDPSAQGVEILDVDDDSPASAAGLRPGYVISSMDGKRIKSINDLLLEFKNRAPNPKVKVGYMVRTNLGWMGNSVVAALSLAPEQR
jgi:membrane-associated protease RseP (regulator of RpoE activity)